MNEMRKRSDNKDEGQVDQNEELEDPVDVDYSWWGVDKRSQRPDWNHDWNLGLGSMRWWSLAKVATNISNKLYRTFLLCISHCSPSIFPSAPKWLHQAHETNQSLICTYFSSCRMFYGYYYKLLLESSEQLKFSHMKYRFNNTYDMICTATANK